MDISVPTVQAERDLASRRRRGHPDYWVGTVVLLVISRRTALALVLALALALPASRAAADTGGAGIFENSGVGRHSPFVRQGMWIWYVDQSQGGDLPAIVATAHRHHIGTVYIKSGDGTTYWEQFSGPLVAELHRAGLKVCAWQFVYGNRPAAEARIGAARGRSRRRLPGDRRRGPVRRQVRRRRPLHRAPPRRDRRRLPALPRRLPLCGLPPGLPLLGLPRAGRGDGQPAADVLEGHRHLGRTRSSPTPTSTTGSGGGRSSRSARPTGRRAGSPLRLFRRYSASYGAVPSWWDWQETAPAEWGALGAPGGGAEDAPASIPKSNTRCCGWGRKATSSSGRRSGWSPPGAEIEVDGIFEGDDAPRGESLPGSARPAGRRPARHRHLGAARRLHAGAGRMVGERLDRERR